MLIVYCSWLLTVLGRNHPTHVSNQTILFIIIIIYFIHAQLGSDVCPDMKPLHISLNTAHSGCKPSTSMSSFTHSLQVLLPLPLLFSPTTSTFLQANTQSSFISILTFQMPKPSQSTMPHHLSHYNVQIFFSVDLKYFLWTNVWTYSSKITKKKTKNFETWIDACIRRLVLGTWAMRRGRLFFYQQKQQDIELAKKY